LAGVDPAGPLRVQAMAESLSRRRLGRPPPFPSASFRWCHSRAPFVAGSPSPMPLEPPDGCSQPPSWQLRAVRLPPRSKRRARPVTCSGRYRAPRPPSPSGHASRRSQLAHGDASTAPLSSGCNHRIARRRRTKHPRTHRMQPAPRHAQATTARLQQLDYSRATTAVRPLCRVVPGGPCT